MVRVIWSRQALRELAFITDYITADDMAAAARMRDKLLRLANSLESFPNRGRPVGRFRELTSAPPFVLRYQVDAETVTIVSVRHGRQARSR